MDILGYIKKTKKRKLFVFYLLIIASLVFFSNIFMHIIVVTGKETGYQLMTLDNTRGYDLEGNKYTPSEGDPQMYFRCESDDINSIRIDFAAPLESDSMIEVYFPDENGSYAEERSRRVSCPAGETRAEINIEAGDYATMRIDINGNFSLDKVYQNCIFPRIAYAQKNIRYGVWGACLLCSFIVFCLLVRNEKWMGRIESGYAAVMRRIFIKENYIIVGGIFICVLVGCAIEFIKVSCTDSIFNYKKMLILAGGIFIVWSFVYMREYYKNKIEKMTFILFLFCGIISALVLPVFLGISWDDETHYIRTVSSARYWSHTLTSAEIDFDQAGFVNALVEPEKLTKERKKTSQKQWDALYQTGKVETNEGYQLSIKDIGYLPAIIGVWISYGLCLSFSHSIIFIRMINILFVAVMIYFSMRSVRSGKMLVAAVAFVPTVFFLASNFSYDTWLTILMIYGFSRYFGEIQHRERKLTWKNFLGIFIPLFLSLLPKLVYAPMLFLTVYMPKEKFEEKRWRIAYRACFVMAALVVVAAVLYAAGGNIDFGTGDSRGGAEVNADAQFEYIRHNFGTYLLTLKNYLKYYFSYSASAEYLTHMAYLGRSSLQIISILIMGFVALTDRSYADRKLFPVLLKFSSVVMYVLIGAICATAMYIIFTPVGLGTVNGCQGRYIIPAIFPVLFILSRFGMWNFVREKCPAEYYNFAVLGVSTIFLLYHLWVNCAVKYC